MNRESYAATRAGHARHAHQRPVLRIHAGVFDWPGVIEGFENLADMKSNLMPLRLHTTRELKMVRPIAEPNASRNGEVLKLALQPSRIVV